jgi:hypothetical protein
MYKYTLQDAQNYGPLKIVSGVVPTSQQFTDYINEAQRRLMRRGDWFDTDQVISLCVSGCVIQWPRWVGAIRGVRFGKGKPANIFNNWYSFVGPHRHASGFHCDAVIEDADLAPTANEVSGTNGKQIRYYVVLQADVGKTITLFGTQYGGQPLQEQNTAQQWQNGQTIAAGMPFGVSASLVTRIDAISRQATSGMAYLYEYDPTTGMLRDLAAFEPGDTNPRIRRSRIINKPFSHNSPDANGIFWTKIEALVKVQFIEVVNLRDFLMIDNFDALKFMVSAIKCEEAKDLQTSEANITQAIRELNFELRDKNSDDQTPVRVNAVIGRRIVNPI